MTRIVSEPIIPGFHPDPSICRVGQNYYVANSSFEFFPAIPIWHSTDLRNWELLGNALNREDQFTPGHAAASGGLYAPTLRHHDGRFWLITTDVSGQGGQLLMTAEDPLGPWAEPIRIPQLVGIDPDIAWTDSGECYVTYCSSSPSLGGIVQARIDTATGHALEQPRKVWSGTGLAFPEAPHLYERDGWWYLLIAEGGTERGHGASIARGTSPEGPFLPAQNNPFFSHRSTDDSVQSTGHADLVETDDGSWAMVYLGTRPAGVTPMFHVNGRETFLAGIDWVDGWPTVDETRFATPAVLRSFVDHFDDETLHPRWVSPGASLRAITMRDEHSGLVLRPGRSASGTISMVAMRPQDRYWQLTARIDASTGSCGLRLRLDEAHWLEARVQDGYVTCTAQIGPLRSPVGMAVEISTTTPTLVLEAMPPSHGGPDDLRVLLVGGGESRVIARVDGRYFSTEVAGGFTGRVVGLRAIDGTPRLLSVHYTGTAAPPA